MNSIPVLQQQLDQVCQALGHPQVSIGIKPVFQGQQWLLSSDICLLIARRIGQNPEIIADDFLKRLPSSSQGEWQRISGYIVFTISNQSTLIADYEDLYSNPQKVNILVPGRDRRQTVSGYLRLVSLALLQAVWATRRGVPVDIIIAEESFTEQLRTSNIVEILDRVASLSLYQELAKEETTSYVLERLTHDTCSLYTVFLSPGEIDPTLFKQGGQILNFDEQVSVIIPERGWMADIDALPASFSYLNQIQDGAYSLLLHLASSSRGVDIEWGAPVFQERKNLSWLLRTLLARYEYLSDHYSSRGMEPISITKNQYEGNQGFIARFLPLFFERAVYRGEVAPLITSATTACMGLSLALNGADFRIGLENDDLSSISRLLALDPLMNLLNKLFFHVD